VDNLELCLEAQSQVKPLDYLVEECFPGWRIRGYKLVGRLEIGGCKMSLPKETLEKALEKLREAAKSRYEARRSRIVERYEILARELEDKYREVARRFSEMLKK